MEVSSATRLAPVERSTAQTLPARSPPASAQRPSDGTAGDQVSISPQAYAKLAAESSDTAASVQQPPDSVPSETRKFIYGTLGLDRPTDVPSAPPQDSYTYGRFASAALTVATLLALV